MKKIFAYVGSQKGERSFTSQITKKLIDAIVLQGQGELQYQIFTPDQLVIEYCQGCNQCFESGNCPRDACDSMRDIKNLMIESDLVIFSSPVYAHNVSGQMKVFLDRLTYWQHLFRLIGKIGITITTSDSNGNEYVNGYLNKVMKYSGLEVIANLKAYSTAVGEKKLEEDIKLISKQVCEYLFSAKALTGSLIQEVLFQNLKEHMIGLKENGLVTAEYSYWKKHGFLNLENYAELILATK